MRKLASNMDKPLLITSIIMLVFGLLMIFSSSNAMANLQYDDPYKFLFRQALFLLMGLVIFFIIIKKPTKSYYKLSLLILTVFLLLLFGLDIFGTATRSAKSWIPLGAFHIQPSEFVKMALIMYMATYYEKMVLRNRNDMKTAAIPLVIGAFCFILTVAQPDFGTALIIFGLIAITFFSVPIEKRLKTNIIEIVTIIILSIIALLYILSLAGYNFLADKADRFNIFEPCTRYQEASGWQVCNGYIAINNGGLYGVGLGNSTQKHLYLPEAHTDFIFPIIVEEWGIIGGIVVLSLMLFIIYRIIRISRRSTSLRGSILAFGVATYMLLHIFINLIGVFGLGPLTGVPLPFLSYGGSNLWTLIIGLAIVQRVEIERNERIKQNILKKSLI